ncbi:hypothetical protein UPYG_G00014220 [Umbra pygmaea]|uniref:Interleukin-17 receptor C/E N-terminal domain-containing protein n=1 Tax=Umbra pygmaea TaxID=75934 RepID=A0ABD0XJ96_UMBPY
MAGRFFCVIYILLTMLQLKKTSAGALLMEEGEHLLTCGQVLADCSVKDVALPGMKAQVKLWDLDLQLLLCCPQKQDCKPCLQVKVIFKIKDQNEDQEVSGDHNDEDYSSKEMEEEQGRALWEPPNPKEYSLRLCYSSPGLIDCCKEVTFTLRHSALVDQTSSEMWLRLILKPVSYGSPVNVKALSTSMTMNIPSLEEVCSPNLERFVEDCEVPRLRAVLDEERDVALLQLDLPNRTMFRRMAVSMTSHVIGINNNADGYQEWEEGQRELTIPLRSVVPCLCFMVRWKGKELHRDICPFINNTELFRRMWQNNVSVSVQEAQMNMANSTALSWNVTAPCQLEGDLWLCRKTTVEGQCEEVNGSRQRMHNPAYGKWTNTIHGLRKEGEFINVNPHPGLCVQMRIQGMDTKLDPICPFTIPRNRWTLAVLIGILIICLAVFCAFVIHVAIKG